ncbi:hypothetical protein GCM10010989_09640 [Croceicoccus pelagius]|uniref:Uncharacterized protein n=1 Tax=Croceicoccus pelagius TaxID=1703341 RepID=A0A916YBE8_9SPHN|nr:hypothetical protein GCM10010989_09640 [Croceicoccus pelagius]
MVHAIDPAFDLGPQDSSQMHDGAVGCRQPGQFGNELGAPENLKEPIENWAKVESEATRKKWTSLTDIADGNS